MKITNTIIDIAGELKPEIHLPGVQTKRNTIEDYFIFGTLKDNLFSSKTQITHYTLVFGSNGVLIDRIYMKATLPREYLTLKYLSHYTDNFLDS